MKYSEKLRDPRWQKKRLEIFQRDGFTCMACGDKSSTLHVHHWYYERGEDPWDTPDRDLETLCELCHRSESDNREAAEQDLIDTLYSQRFHVADISRLVVGIINTPMGPHNTVLISGLFAWMCCVPHVRRYMESKWYKGAKRIADRRRENAPRT
jgi:hypothetical protein